MYVYTTSYVLLGVTGADFDGVDFGVAEFATACVDVGVDGTDLAVDVDDLTGVDLRASGNDKFESRFRMRFRFGRVVDVIDALRTPVQYTSYIHFRSHLFAYHKRNDDSQSEVL